MSVRLQTASALIRWYGYGWHSVATLLRLERILGRPLNALRLGTELRRARAALTLVGRESFKALCDSHWPPVGSYLTMTQELGGATICVLKLPSAPACVRVANAVFGLTM